MEQFVFLCEEMGEYSVFGEGTIRDRVPRVYLEGRKLCGICV